MDNVEKVDVTGRSIGKGFQGTVKRWNFGRGPMGHGSKNHREPGSIGAGTTPSRVIKGKRMAGNMGNEQVTIQNLMVVKVDLENNVILVKGNVPGPKKSLVLIKSGVKANGKKLAAPELITYTEEVVEEMEQQVKHQNNGAFNNISFLFAEKHLTIKDVIKLIIWEPNHSHTYK